MSTFISVMMWDTAGSQINKPESESEFPQSCSWLSATLWTVCILPGSSVHGIFQARILEWTAISFSRGSTQPRDRTRVSHVVSRLYRLSHRESLNKPGWREKNVRVLLSDCFWLMWLRGLEKEFVAVNVSNRTGGDREHRLEFPPTTLPVTDREAAERGCDVIHMSCTESR